MRSLRARITLRKARTLWREGHTERGWQLAHRALNLLPAAASTHLAGIADRVAILESLALFASDLANHSEVQQYCDEAVALLERVNPGARRDEWLVAVLVLKGNSQRLSAGYDEAALTLNRALAQSERAGQSPYLAAGPLNALGILSKDRGHYAEAGIYYTTALGLLAHQDSKDAPQLAGIYHNLAGLAHVQGKFLEAEEPARRAIQLRQSASLKDPAGWAADLSVLGAVLAGQDRLDEASAALSEALALWRSLYGNGHYEIAVQLHNLAAIQQAKGEYSSAETTLQEALEIKRSTLGEIHPEIASILNNLATVYVDADRRPEAAECYGSAIAMFTQTLGVDHPSTIVSIENLKNLYDPN